MSTYWATGPQVPQMFSKLGHFPASGSILLLTSTAVSHQTLLIQDCHCPWILCSRPNTACFAWKPVSTASSLPRAAYTWHFPKTQPVTSLLLLCGEILTFWQKWSPPLERNIVCEHNWAVSPSSSSPSSALPVLRDSFMLIPWSQDKVCVYSEESQCSKSNIGKVAHHKLQQQVKDFFQNMKLPSLP